VVEYSILPLSGAFEMEFPYRRSRVTTQDRQKEKKPQPPQTIMLDLLAAAAFSSDQSARGRNEIVQACKSAPIEYGLAEAAFSYVVLFDPKNGNSLSPRGD